MSGHVHPFPERPTPQPDRPVLHPVASATFHLCRELMEDMKEGIEDAGSVAEAFQMYQWLATLSRDMDRLVDQCGAKCEDLMERRR